MPKTQSKSQVEQEIWDQILAGVDEDGSGEIDFGEFCTMMHKLV